MDLMTRDTLVIAAVFAVVVVLGYLSSDWLVKRLATGKEPEKATTATSHSSAEAGVLSGDPITDFIKANFPGVLPVGGK